MPPSLLTSQFATLEEPADAIEVDVGGEPSAIAAAALARLRA
jgi:gluconate kinase